MQPMNRREFHSLAFGAAASAALPAPALGSATAVLDRGKLAWATAMAQAQNRASPALFQQMLKVSEDTAQALFDDLLSQGVITKDPSAPMARATKPVFANGSALVRPRPEGIPEVMRKTVAKIVEPENEDSQSSPDSSDKVPNEEAPVQLQTQPKQS